MFTLDDDLCWSASDLTIAALCEFAFLRKLDYALGRAARLPETANPLEDHIARLGDLHEAEILEQLRADHRIAELPHLTSAHHRTALEAARDATLAAFDSDVDVVYQPAFFDGEFFGYADFVERSDSGWVVCDAKLARQAKPQALLQLGAYAAQLLANDIPLAPVVSLLLGNGERADFRTADVMPAFAERRARLRQLIDGHIRGGVPVRWGDDSVIACGRCAECDHAAVQADDLLIVAGLRMDQRRKLRAAGVTTLADLADSTVAPPDGVAPATFAKLREQAQLQWQFQQARAIDPDAQLRYALTADAAATLSRLPAPSAGDLFFDFEGDPLYDEGDRTRTGLEYLWGVMDAEGAYEATWAHSLAEERAAFEAFIDAVVLRRAQHPDMHIYHYAPYETTALKRMAMRYQTREEALDDLLRDEVFVDLYATVRGSVRVSAPSYSIKKLEPLYMGDDYRDDTDDAVGDGGASVVAYHEYRAWREEQPEAAAQRLSALQDYNAYDCLSTLRLRDWLLRRAEEAGVRDQIVARFGRNVVDSDDEDLPDYLFDQLMARSGPARRLQRSPEEQAYAMLATALDYYRRERKQFWWEHYERLMHPVEDWQARDVFVVESAEVISDWEVPEGRKRNAKRQVRLKGDWTPGSKLNDKALVVYERPGPSGCDLSEGARYATTKTDAIFIDPDDERIVILQESRNPAEVFTELPKALAPAAPPSAGMIAEAIRAVASAAADSPSPPLTAAIDLLVRRPPRLHLGQALPDTGEPVADIVAALLAMDNSYLAIQGPPGTGKTYTGAHVIAELVNKHRWRIGIVAQSHAVVENMLAGIVKAGLDPALVGKNDNESTDPSWTVLKDGVPSRVRFLADRAQTGCVLGGTAWTFSNRGLWGALDLLVIDEAGQFSLAPTIGVSMSAHRLLLLGDPQQLPQVTHGTHAEPVNDSALGWLMDGHDTLPAEFGYFLADSYRMHPQLCRRVSELSYDGRLSAAAAASLRDLAGVPPGLMVANVEHVGNRTDSVEEAAEVVEVVRAHLGKSWHDPDDPSAPRPLGQSDFVVVAPYNAQVERIRRSLAEAGLPGVRVGTVDKFQGQEAPVAIVSMTASSYGDVPRGMGFLLNRNRVNVAVSRAQWLAVIVRSSALTAFMPTSAEGVLELGGFIGLCHPSP